MLKRLLVFVLLACMMSTYFSRDFAVAGFELNQKYISGKLCENKDKPWMHCNGHCYLMKKLKQAQDNEQKQADNNLRNSFQVLWFVQTPVINYHSLADADIAQRLITHYTYAYSNQYTSSIFRPPKSVA